MKNKIKNVVRNVITSLYVMFLTACPVFADVTSAGKDTISLAMTIVSAIPGVSGLFALIQGFSAYGEAKQEGAQAQGKAYAMIGGGLFLLAVCVLVNTKCKDIVFDFFGI